MIRNLIALGIYGVALTGLVVACGGSTSSPGDSSGSESGGVGGSSGGGANLGGSGAAETGGSSTGGSAPVVSWVGAIGEACTKAGELGCVGVLQKSKLVCGEDLKWSSNGSCDIEGESCVTTGALHGTCALVNEDCAAGYKSWCSETSITECSDAGTITTEPCDGACVDDAATKTGTCYPPLECPSSGIFVDCSGLCPGGDGDPVDYDSAYCIEHGVGNILNDCNEAALVLAAGETASWRVSLTDIEFCEHPGCYQQDGAWLLATSDSKYITVKAPPGWAIADNNVACPAEWVGVECLQFQGGLDNGTIAYVTARPEGLTKISPSHIEVIASDSPAPCSP